MTNKQLIKKWKNLSIQFKSSKKIIPLSEIFLLCPGEGVITIDGGEEKVVFFYQGYDEKGSPAAMFKSDRNDNCYAFALDSGKKTHVRSHIGKFVKNE
jgi:hypothetical protein